MVIALPDLPMIFQTMILIGLYPIIWHIKEDYVFFGYKEFIICLGYKGNLLKISFNYEAHTRDFTVTLGANEA